MPRTTECKDQERWKRFQGRVLATNSRGKSPQSRQAPEHSQQSQEHGGNKAQPALSGPDRFLQHRVNLLLIVPPQVRRRAVGGKELLDELLLRIIHETVPPLRSPFAGPVWRSEGGT